MDSTALYSISSEQVITSKRGYPRINMLKQFFNKNKTAADKGSISIIVTLSVLAIIISIGLSASYTLSGELSISTDSNESAVAYYAAESGMERAMYERFVSEIQPLQANRCPGTCDVSCGCSEGWTDGYCLSVTVTGPDPCDIDSITAIKAIGKFGTVRRSIQITLN